jgi:hypothetical protein
LKFANPKIIVSDEQSNKKNFEFTSLQKIILFKSASIDKGGVQMTPVENYHFAVIKTKSGESFFITNLLAPDVEKAINMIKLVPYERRKLLFATLSEAKQ